MRTQFDQLAKSILDKLLRPVGTVHPQHEVPSTVQAVDIWFEPQPGHAAERARLGPLGRISEEACMLEPFHEAPGLREVRACIRKQYNLAHWQEQEARPAPEEPSFPRLWILSAGRPESVLSGYEMRSMDRDVWLPGFWQAARNHALHVVVLRDLPETRDTLFLRLLGTGTTFLRAATELNALPADAWERQVAIPLLYAYRIALPAGVDLYGTDEDAMEYTDKLEQIYADWKRQENERAVQRTVIGVYERRFGAMPDELRETLGRVHGENALVELITIVASGAHEEVVAAMHQAASAA
jgi:hypothetical protein